MPLDNVRRASLALLMATILGATLTTRAAAQPVMGIFSDSEGTSQSLDLVEPGVPFDLYVLLFFTEGDIGGAAWTLNVEDRGDGITQLEVEYAGNPLNVTDGSVLLEFDPCVPGDGPVLLARYRFVRQDISGLGTDFLLEPNPLTSTTGPTYQTCAGGVVEVDTSDFFIFCKKCTPTKKATWSSVRGRF